MYILKIKVFIFFIISATNAHNFKLCCPFAHQYDDLKETCLSSREPKIFNIYNLTEEVEEINGKNLNVIDHTWCRNNEGVRKTEKVSKQYYLQQNGELYVPDLEIYLKSSQYCLSTNNSGDNIAIICKIETSLWSKVDNNFDIEYPKFEEIFFKNLLNGTVDNCVICTVENTSTCRNECSTNIIRSVEFVNVLQETKNKKIVQVNKKKCPYWLYTYDLNADGPVHLSILNQTCDGQMFADDQDTINKYKIVKLILSEDEGNISSSEEALNVSKESTTKLSTSTEALNEIIENCVKCTIEKTCANCDKNHIESITFVDAFSVGTKIHKIKINETKCPNWEYAITTENNLVKLSIVKQPCNESEATNNVGKLFYVAIAAVVFLSLLVIGLLVLYFLF